MNILQAILQGAVGGGAMAGGAGKAIADGATRGAMPLAHLAAGGTQAEIPVGQPLTAQHIATLPPNVQPLAQIYSQNPQDPRVAHIDPAIFGYAADNTVAPGQPVQARPFVPIQPSTPAGTGMINIPGATNPPQNSMYIPRR